MTAMILVFPTLPSALVFLQRESPASQDEAWAMLGQMHLLRSGHGSAVGLEVAEGGFDKAGLERAIRCGGQPAGDEGAREQWKERVSMQTLFRRVRLEASSRTEHGRHFLVIPQGNGVDGLAQLIDWISEVDGCSVWVREVLESGLDKPFTVFELRVEGETPIATPAGLPGAPHVLAAIDENVFVPAGMECPLLPAHRFLIPPSGDGRLHAWVIGDKGTPSYLELTTVGAGAAPMARLVMLPGDVERAAAVTGAPGRVALPLRLRPIHAKRRLRGSTQVLYVVESRGGELGAALLRLFDHTDAGIEQFTYYNKLTGTGPNAVVQHFLLAEARIADDDMWPELRRYDLPRTLAEVGLPLFLPADADFTPDLAGVINGLDADDPFLNSLRIMTGLGDAPSDRLAIVEPSANGGPWRITTLEQGRPLESFISAVLEEVHREPVRRLIDVERVDLTQERQRYEERWLAVGQRESAQIADITRRLAESLAEAVRSVDQQLSELRDRVTALREVSVGGQELVTMAPRQVGSFVQGIVDLVESVAAPRRAWLLDAESQRRALEALLQAARDFQRSVQEEVDHTNRIVTEGRQELTAAGDRVSRARATLVNSMAELEPHVASAEAISQQLASEIQGRQARLMVLQSGLEARERSLRERSEEVDRFQQAVQTREEELSRQARALEARRASLEARQTTAQQAERDARAEESRLRKIEAEDLPAAKRRHEEAEQDLRRWRSKRLDESLRQAESEIAVLDRKRSQLKDQHDHLERKQSELARLEAEVTELRVSVDRLIKQRLEPAIEATSQEVSDLSSDAVALETMGRMLRAARSALDEARSAHSSILRARGTEELAKDLAELEATAGSLEMEYDRDASGVDPSGTSDRLAKVERQVKDLRRRAKNSRVRWLARWLGGGRP